MQARYTRIFTDETGASKFEELSIELLPGYAVPPTEPLHFAPFLATTGSFWIGAPSTWKGDVRHPAPQRQIFITVSGEYQVTIADGSTRNFPAGSVLLIEDTTGSGHSTKILEDAIVFAVGLHPMA